MTAPDSLPALPEPAINDVGVALAVPSAGRILRLKIGYNPNSSSIGTIVFGIPASLAVLTVAFGTAAGILTAALLRARPGRDAGPATTGAAPAAGEPADRAGATNADGERPAEDRGP